LRRGDIHPVPVYVVPCLEEEEEEFIHGIKLELHAN
jgi:hypothetical protein